MATAISERSGVNLFTIKEHLGIPQTETGHDAWLTRKMKQVKSLADGFCNNPFTDLETGEELPIPDEVDHWIEEVVARWYVRRENGKNGESVSAEGSVSWGQLDYSGLAFAKRYLV